MKVKRRFIKIKKDKNFFDQKINFIENFLNLIIELNIKKTPICIRKFISPVFIFLKFRIVARLKNIKLDIYLLKGEEKFSKFKITVLFLGDDVSRLYISSILFSDYPKVEFIGRTFFWRYKKIIKKISIPIDASFIQTDRFFSGYFYKDNFLMIPSWVEMKLKTAASYDKLYTGFKKSAIEDLRLIKKYKYSYEISKDFKKFEYFYHKIRLPYISNRLGDLTLPDTKNYYETRDIFERSNLFLIKEKEKYVAGSLLVDHHGYSHMCYMGVMQPEYYLPRGAGAALYYYFILWANENDLNFLDFGNNRSFLNDGSFRYKRKWGASVHISKRFFGIFGFKVFNYESYGIHSFLNNNPFTFITKNKINGAIFLKNYKCKHDVISTYNKYNTAGMSNIFILPLKENLKDIMIKLSNFKISKNLATFDNSNIKRYDDLLIIENSDITTFERSICNDDHTKKKANYQFEENIKDMITKCKVKSVSDIDIKELDIKYKDNFEKFLRKYPKNEDIIKEIFLNVFPSLEKEGLNIDILSENKIDQLFLEMYRDKIKKNSISDIVKYIINNNRCTIADAIKICNAYVLSDEEITQVIMRITKENMEFIKSNGMYSRNYLVSILMKELHRNASGRRISRLLIEEINKILNS